ncbi:MAG: hypothetical protein KDD62_09750, partial [Bdellovibrionales bacterium]|nr:hypothetical protein [Bdellovibrionales bacterium]
MSDLVVQSSGDSPIHIIPRNGSAEGGWQDIVFAQRSFESPIKRSRKSQADTAIEPKSIAELSREDLIELSNAGK